MNIVLYVNSFLPLVGGREVVVHQLALAFQGLGHNVRVAGPRGWRHHRKLRFGYPVHRWPGLQGLFHEQTYLAHLFLDTTLYGCDILHAHSTYPAGYIAARLKRFKDYPIVITPHGEDIHVVPDIKFGQRLDPAQRPKIQYALERATLITAISKSIEASLLDANVDPEKTRRIPNGVDNDRFEAAPMLDVREWLKLPSDARLIATIGNYHPRKGHDVLVRAMAAVVKNEPRAALVIVGSKTEMLRPLIRQLNLDRHVVLTGPISLPVPSLSESSDGHQQRQPDYVAAILKSSEMYVSAGIGEGAEGLSLAVLEAMACGTPVVATNISGNRDVVRDGENGMLVPPSAPTPLAEAILQLLSDEKMREQMSANARTVGRGYQWQAVAEQYLDVYREAIEKAKK